MAENLFVQEIDFREIDIQGIVGKGSYGTVRKGKWRNQDVAVKIIETEQEKNAFIVEVEQLSRVDHENIVKLYGACTKTPSTSKLYEVDTVLIPRFIDNVCLVMEYAEGGSLYNVLHSNAMKEVKYTAAHALSWLLQTAKGVAYLHNMKPRPLIHRDLKPPNLLLINCGTVLKICDFGTACAKHTNMTNSKGSAAWMAPEVFEGSQYSEKCDVFSWGIILWEVLTRERPFCDGEGITPFQIMWAVHHGKRPPLIQGCPKPLENLMTRCWAKSPSVRPSMNVIQAELSNIFRFMKGADEPIIFPPQQGTGITVETSPTNTPEPDKNETGSSNSKTVEPSKNVESSNGGMFLDVDIGGEKYARDIKRRSADLGVKLPQNLGHRRSGSCDSPYLKTSDTRPTESLNANAVSAEPDQPDSPRIVIGGLNETGVSYSWVYQLEPHLQPLLPVQQCPESMEIYNKHISLAQELIHYRKEISKLEERKKQLLAELQARDRSSTYIDEYLHLKKEKESLLKLRQNLKRQLEFIRSNQQGDKIVRPGGDEWVVVDHA